MASRDQSPSGDAGAVAIGIPVRDEEERLPGLLRALAEQVDAPRFTLCLFLDGCRDGSAAVVEARRSDLSYPIVLARRDHARAPNAGDARRRAMALAARAAPGGVLLTTDADGEPAADWIAANLAALATADVVAGRIVRAPDPPSPVQDRIEAYYEGLHAIRRAIDPVDWERPPTHHWTSAASLALRTRDYHALGGFEAVPHGEDARLCDAAARAGLRVRRDARVVVRTSARRHGRAARGFASLLAAFDAGEDEVRMAHPADEFWRFRMQADARTRHGVGDYGDLADALALGEDEVARVAGECRNGNAFAARIVGSPPGGMRQVTLDEAERLLARLEATA